MYVWQEYANTIFPTLQTEVQTGALFWNWDVSIRPGPWGGSKKLWTSSGTSDNHFPEKQPFYLPSVYTTYTYSRQNLYLNKHFEEFSEAAQVKYL